MDIPARIEELKKALKTVTDNPERYANGKIQELHIKYDEIEKVQQSLKEVEVVEVSDLLRDYTGLAEYLKQQGIILLKQK